VLSALGSARRQQLNQAGMFEMVGRQGRHFSQKQIKKITRLLAKTDLSMAEIANRMDCTTSAVSTVNRKYGIRIYAKKGGQWVLKAEYLHKPTKD
jgi:predicted DNA-binding protein YlxM (UPF0122 family)